jgi:hypothetical protein
MQSNLKHLFVYLRPETLNRIREALTDALQDFASDLAAPDAENATDYNRDTVVAMANIYLAIEQLDAHL